MLVLDTVDDVFGDCLLLIMLHPAQFNSPKRLRYHDRHQ